MKINSKDFGVIEVNKEDIIHFPEGLFAFEEENEFVLIKKDGFMQKWLQSAINESTRFIVFDPADIVEGYAPNLPDEVLEKLAIDDENQISIYLIAVIPENIKDMTVNLKSPVIINHQSLLGEQVILDKEAYPIRYHVFKEEGRVPAKC